MIDERVAEAKRIAETILQSKKYDFADLKPSDLQEGLAAIYAIYNKDTGETLYVGRTKNIRQRLYNNHLMGPRSNARLKKYLVDDPTVPDVTTMEEAKKYLRDYCNFQYLAESDMTRRGQIEGLLSFLLNVRYIHEEH